MKIMRQSRVGSRFLFLYPPIILIQFLLVLDRMKIKKNGSPRTTNPPNPHPFRKSKRLSPVLVCGMNLFLPVFLFSIAAAGKNDTNGTLPLNPDVDDPHHNEDPCNKSNVFKCASGNCIPVSFYCDGEKDCNDGSDEIEKVCSSYRECPEEEFRCVSGECKTIVAKCDGVVDCLDGWSDEVNCTVPNECPREEGKFLCRSGDKCLELHQVCDKTPDCADKSDEFPGCEKACSNAPCQHGCLPDPSSTNGTGFCFCFIGYHPTNSDNSTCEDVNECQEFGVCSQKCTNVDGSYECSCIPGFRSGNNNASCELLDNTTSLIYAQFDSLRIHKINSRDVEYIVLDESGSPVGVTFDARRNWIYWTDVQEESEAIWRIHPNGTEKQLIFSSGRTMLPEGIAFDWIANNIYFTDSNRSQIMVCNVENRNCSVIAQELDRPRDIALHPNKGIMFWTDWGIRPAIVRSGMDGSEKIAIITDNLKWPNGITIDQGNERIYWTDAGIDRIETADLDGQYRRIVHSTGVKHPFGIDIVGDHVYWSDWSLFEVQRSNKFDGSEHKTVVKARFSQLNGLTVFHKANQPIIRKNHCEKAKCSHICTLAHSNSYRCLCPEGMSLDQKDFRKCIPTKEIIKPISPGGYSKSSKKDKSKTKKPKEPKGSTTSSTTPSIVGDSDYDRNPHPWDAPSDDHVKPEDVKKDDDDDTDRKNGPNSHDNKEENGSFVARKHPSIHGSEASVKKEVVKEGSHPWAIVTAVMILIALIGVILGVILYRKNIHPKALARPYMNHWVKYVNRPVQNFFEGRGGQGSEQLDGKSQVYDDVYPNPNIDQTYSRPYESIDDDSSVNIYEDPDEGHRIHYSQKDKLLP